MKIPDWVWLAGGALFLAACFQQEDLPGPVVYLRFGEAYNLAPLTTPTKWTTDDRKWIERGAQEWRRLGFDVQAMTTIAPNPLPPGAMVVTLYRDEYLAAQNTFRGLSQRETRTIFINSRMKEFSLMHTAAHEMGHMLLDTSAHLSPPKKGVMDTTGDYWSLTDDDVELACQVASRCEEF